MMRFLSRSATSSRGNYDIFVSVVEPEKANPFGGIIASKSPDIVDVDADHKDPQLCCIYAPDIYNNLRVAEVCTTNIFFSLL